MIPYYNVDTYSPQIAGSLTDQIFDSVCRIETDEGNATGFFLKLNIKDKKFKCLVTNCHVIPKKFIIDSKTIYIYYGKQQNEITKRITLDKNERFIRCFDELKDITLVEIKNYDYIPDYKFLLPDLEYKNGYNGYDQYLYKKYSLARYPYVENNHNSERHLSSGLIAKIGYNNNYFEFEHSLGRSFGSSGSPICLLSNPIPNPHLKKLNIIYIFLKGFIQIK